MLGGTITHAGTPQYHERGIVWSTLPNPIFDPSDSRNRQAIPGLGTGGFSTMIEGLQPETSYFVRAYTISLEGGTPRITYGNQVSFTTIEGGVRYIDANGASQISPSNISELDGTQIGTGWYFVSGNRTIESRITISGNVRLILTDGSHLTVNGGINVPPGSSFTIYGQTNGTGRLTALATQGNAGIGGNTNASCLISGQSGGTVIINGGVIIATGGNASGSGGGAGIGGSGGGSGGFGSGPSAHGNTNSQSIGNGASGGSSGNSSGGSGGSEGIINISPRAQYPIQEHGRVRIVIPRN